MSVTLLVVALEEEQALPALVARLAALDPKPAEVLLVDGGSMDGTVAIARAAGWRVLAAERGRALQMNAGARAAAGDAGAARRLRRLSARLFLRIELAAPWRRWRAPTAVMPAFTDFLRSPPPPTWAPTVARSLIFVNIFFIAPSNPLLL